MTAKEKLKDRIVSELNNWMEANAELFQEDFDQNIVEEIGFGYCVQRVKEEGQKDDDKIFYLEPVDEIVPCRNKIQTIARYLKTHKIDRSVIEKIKAGKIR